MRCADFKTSYAADEAIFQSFFVKFWMGILFAALLVFPFFADAYMMYILTGFTGQISLGHAAFIGIGGYTAAILITRLQIPFWAALPSAGLASAVAGVVIGIPSLRVKGLYLCIATLAAQFIFEFLFVHLETVTRGIRGINLPAPELFSITLDTERKFYFLTLALVVVLVAYARNLFRSRVGRAFVAIRDRDLAAEIMGINLFRYKLLAFAISSFYAGVCGALWVSFMRIVTPEHFPFHLSIQYLAMIIVGGLGSVLGSIFGAIFMTLTPELLSILSSAMSKLLPGLQKLFIPMKEVVFGLLIVLFLVFEPRGLAEIWRRIKAFFMLWPFSY